MTSFIKKLAEWHKTSPQEPDTLNGRPILLPGHNYLGPGNPLNNGEPVDAADRIALHHDHHYAQAQHPEDIRNADVEAIRDFGQEFLQSGSICAGLGAVGIAGKYIAESIVGVQYPKMPPTKRGIDAGKPAEASGKRLRSGNRYPESAGEADGDAGEEMDEGDNAGVVAVGNPGEPGGRMANAGQPSGQGRGGFGGTGMLKMFKCPKNLPSTHVIHHEEYMNFWGFGWANMVKNQNRQLLTSIGYIPVGMVGFWLSPADLEALPIKSHVSIADVALEVVASGLTTSFETATTITGTASAHHWVQGVVNVGLNHAFPIVPIKPTVTNMKINDYTQGSGIRYMDRRWGPNSYNSTTTEFLFPASLKIPRDCEWYTSIFQGRTTDTGQGTANNQGVNESARFSGGFPTEGTDYYMRGRPSLEHELIDFTAGDCAGQTILNYHYKPTDGLLWDIPAQLPIAADKDSVLTDTVFGPHYSETSGKNYSVATPTEGNNKVEQTSTYEGQLYNQFVSRRPEWTCIGYAMSPLEKQNFKQHNGCHTDITGNANIQPSCHVGLYPVFPNAPGTAAENPINVKLTCKILTKCVLKVGGHSMYTWQPTRPHTGTRTYIGWEPYESSVAGRGFKRFFAPEPYFGGAVTGPPNLTVTD